MLCCVVFFFKKEIQRERQSGSLIAFILLFWLKNNKKLESLENLNYFPNYLKQ